VIVSISFYSFIGGLLLLLHVSNKHALHARGSFTIVYDSMTWYSAVWNMTASDSRLCLSI